MDVDYFRSWHKTDLPMQSPHVRCWGNNGSRISVLRLVFRRRLARARRKLEQRGRRALPGLLALLTNQSPGEIVHACRRHVRQRGEIDIARRQASAALDLQPCETAVGGLIDCRARVDWSAVASHLLIPRLASEAVGLPDQRLALAPLFRRPLGEDVRHRS